MSEKEQNAEQPNGVSSYPKPLGLNPNLATMANDHLYHLGYSTKDDLKQLFGDVKFVCMGGSVSRMEQFANFARQELANVPGFDRVADKKPENICRTDRYVMYKVGPLLSINHGMGFSSICILLHEVIKLLNYAGASDAVIIRIGTSGGLGIEPGSVVVTDTPLNGQLQPQFNVVILGKVVPRHSALDSAVCDQLVDSGTSFSFPVIKGNTMSAEDFYEGQARLDGAICNHSEEDKKAFLKRAHDAGVRNIEMEAVVLGSMCYATEVRGACVCVTLLNRLEGDQVTMSNKEHSEMQLRPQKVVLEYIRQQMTADTSEPAAKRASL